MIASEVDRRRTFAIISHPDAGKTTITEKLLLLGKAIQQAGTVKSKKSDRYATSDWMELEKQRGISVTTSVMQFPYADCVVNLGRWFSVFFKCMFNHLTLLIDVSDFKNRSRGLFRQARSSRQPVDVALRYAATPRHWPPVRALAPG